MNTLTPHITAYLSARRSVDSYGPKSIRVVGPRLHSLSAHFGRRPINQLNTAAVERWLGSLDHMVVNSRASYLASVRQFTHWLTANKIVDTDPCIEIPKIRRTKTLPRAQQPEAVAATLAACHSERDQAIVWLMVGCGLRRMEVAGLRWDDVDLIDGMIRVRGKGRVERDVALPSEVAAALAPLGRRSGGPVITGRYGGHLSPESVGAIVGRAMRDAGIKQAPYDGISGHALRHTAASDVLDRCGDLRVVQQMLGHEHLSTTSIYLRRIDARAMRQAMEGRDYRAA